MSQENWVQIDGSEGEGGGQILRTAVSLSAITGKPLEIVKVRAGRSKPGLGAQHLTSVKAAAEICGAQLTGAELESQFLRFAPTLPVKPGDYRFDVAEAREGGSAGAASLVLQTVALPLAFAVGEGPVSVSVSGGTHVPMSPSADFLEYVYFPALLEMGMKTRFSTQRAGFFPKGGGEISLSLLSAPSDGILRTQRGKLKRFRAVVTTAALPEHVAERGLAQLKKDLSDFGVPLVSNLFSPRSPGAGAAVLLTAECEHTAAGWSSLGERGKPMERVAQEAARSFKKWFETGLGTEEHLADQLVLPSALVFFRTGAPSAWTTSRVSEHLRTVVKVVEKFLPISIQLTENEDGSGGVKIGAGSNEE